MTLLFWGIAALLTAVALLILLPPLLRARAPAADPRGASNAEVYREQLAELEAERGRGTIAGEEYERARRDIERRVVGEHATEHAAGQAQAVAPKRATRTAVGLALVLPLAVAIAYLALGNPQGLDPVTEAGPAQLEALVTRLTAQLQKTPQDAEAWAVLGRALSSLGHHERAAQALARSLQINPKDHEVLIEFIKTLAQAGQAEFDAHRYDAAIGYWERILPFAPPDSEFARQVRQGIAEARDAAGGSAAKAAATRIEGTVSLSAALKGKVSPQDTVFILARPPGGSRMPLAVTRTTVDQLPYRFTLDDRMAMTPTSKLSDHPKVVVIARISKSGTPTPQAGDVEGMSAAVAPGTTGIEVVLSKVVP